MMSPTVRRMSSATGEMNVRGDKGSQDREMRKGGERSEEDPNVLK